MLALSDIHKVGGDNLALAGGAAAHAADGAVNLVAPAVHLRQLPDGAIGQEILIGEGGSQILDLFAEDVIIVLRKLHKAVVGPDDLPVVLPEHHHRQRGIQEAVLADGIYTAGDGLEILRHTASPPYTLIAGEHVQQYQHHGLRRRQHWLDRDSRRDKQGQTEKIGLKIGFHQPGQLFMHGTLPPLFTADFLRRSNYMIDHCIIP